MDDGLELAAVEPAHQIAGRHEVGDLALAEVAPFGRVAERVVDDNVGAPGLVQAGDQIGTDEAGSARDQQHRLPAATYCLPFAPRHRQVQRARPKSVKWPVIGPPAPPRTLDTHPLARYPPFPRPHWTGTRWQATGLSAQLPLRGTSQTPLSH